MEPQINADGPPKARIASMFVCEPANALVHPNTPGHRCRTAHKIPAAIAPAIRSSAMIPAAPP
jgi:hypothetical protein